MAALEQLETTILETAKEFYAKGPEYAHQTPVLKEVAKRLLPKTLEEQQSILTAWHKLFQSGRLAWGYDLDNPGAPWFHILAVQNRVSPDSAKQAGWLADDELTQDWLQQVQEYRRECDAADRKRLQNSAGGMEESS